MAQSRSAAAKEILAFYEIGDLVELSPGNVATCQGSCYVDKDTWLVLWMQGNARDGVKWSDEMKRYLQDHVRESTSRSLRPLGDRMYRVSFLFEKVKRKSFEEKAPTRGDTRSKPI